MFVARNGGAIYGCWTVRQWEGQEELPDSDPQVIAFLAPKPPINLSDLDNLDRTLKALAGLVRQYSNALKAGTYTAKTPADVRSDFMAIYQALP